MNTQQFGPLIGLSITDPGAAARQVIGAGLTRNTLWMALLLVSVLQALLFSLLPGLLVLPEPLQPIADNPLLMAMVVAGGIVIIAFVLTWAGTMIGGSGDLTAVLAVMTWMQVLRLVGILVSLGLSLLVPTLGAVASLVFGILGIYIFVAMIDVAQGFNSRLKALFLIVFSFLAVSFGTSMALALAAGLILGMG